MIALLAGFLPALIAPAALHLSPAVAPLPARTCAPIMRYGGRDYYDRDPYYNDYDRAGFIMKGLGVMETTATAAAATTTIAGAVPTTTAATTTTAAATAMVITAAAKRYGNSAPRGLLRSREQSSVRGARGGGRGAGSEQGGTTSVAGRLRRLRRAVLQRQPRPALPTRPLHDACAPDRPEDAAEWLPDWWQGAHRRERRPVDDQLPPVLVAAGQHAARCAPL